MKAAQLFTFRSLKIILLATLLAFTTTVVRLGGPQNVLPRRRLLAFDPKTIKVKSNKSQQKIRFPQPPLNIETVDLDSLKESTILDDGTYLLYNPNDMQSPDFPLSFFANNHKRIKRIHYHSKCGKFNRMFGNRMGVMYGIKMVTNAFRIPFDFTCELEEGANPYGAAYLMTLNSWHGGIGPPPTKGDGSEIGIDEVTKMCKHMCTWASDKTLGLSVAAEIMRQDWLHLTDPSLVPIDDHDDVVIHLRLGDGLSSRSGRNQQKGVFPHKTYSSLIEQAQREKGLVRTIGIVAAPFEGQYSHRGGSLLERSIILDLIDSIEKDFPHAKVRLRNSPEQTIMESLARIVHARMAAVCGPSTFCPYALLATKGIGFQYSNPDHFQNYWMTEVVKRNDTSNIRLFQAPLLNGLLINNEKTKKRLNDEEVLNWIRTQDHRVQADIVDFPLYRDWTSEQSK